MEESPLTFALGRPQPEKLMSHRTDRRISAIISHQSASAQRNYNAMMDDQPENEVEYDESNVESLSVEQQLSLSKIKAALELFQNNQITFTKLFAILTNDHEISLLLQQLSKNKITMKDSVLAIHNSQVGEIKTENIVGGNMYNLSIHYHSSSPSSTPSITSTKGNTKPIARRYVGGVDPDSAEAKHNIIYVANVIESHIDEIEYYIGRPTEINIRAVGSGEEIPQGGTTRWYDYLGYLLSINYDNSDIAKSVRIEGLSKEGYSIHGWFEVLFRFGMSVRQQPSDQSIIALFWRDYLGYSISVALNKVDGFIDIIRIYKIP